MIELTILITALASLLIIEVIRGFAAHRRFKKISHLLQVENTQAQFASVRNNLMLLAASEKANPNSQIFALIYQLTTAFMRRPDQYRELSDLIFHCVASLKGETDNHALLTESKTWSIEERGIVSQMANALGNLSIDYSPALRFLYTMYKRLYPTLTPLQMLMQLPTSQETKSKALILEEANEAKTILHKLSRSSEPTYHAATI
jgi:hypothetical protein